MASVTPQQFLRKPVNDLSRPDIVNTVAITVIQSQRSQSSCR
jgi:hypothetical protein